MTGWWITENIKFQDIQRINKWVDKSYRKLLSWTFIQASSNKSPSFILSSLSYHCHYNGGPICRIWFIPVSSYNWYPQSNKHIHHPHTLSASPHSPNGLWIFMHAPQYPYRLLYEVSYSQILSTSSQPMILRWLQSKSLNLIIYVQKYSQLDQWHFEFKEL